MKKIMLTVGFLALSSTAFAADISKTCETYFTAVDSYIELLSGHAEVADQVNLMKSQMDEAKKQLAEMPLEQQEMGCKAGLEGIEEAQKMLMAQ